MQLLLFCIGTLTKAFRDSAVLPSGVGIRSVAPWTFKLIIGVPTVIFYNEMWSKIFNTGEIHTHAEILCCARCFGNVLGSVTSLLEKETNPGAQALAFCLDDRWTYFCGVSPGPISDKWLQKLLLWRMFPWTLHPVQSPCTLHWIPKIHTFIRMRKLLWIKFQRV